MTDTTTEPKAALPQIMPTGGQVVAVVPQSVEEIFRVSKGVVQSGLAPYALTGKTDTAEKLNKAVSAVAIVIMAGAELGLPPMVALRSFTAINGRPALYGDGLINVVRRSGRVKMLKVGYTRGNDFDLFVRAGFIPEPRDDKHRTALEADFLSWPIDQRTGGFCEATRADTAETKSTIFTVEQAKRAALWQTETEVMKDVWENGNKTRKKVPNDSPWYRYPERMLGWRAAGFGLRELFGDVLGGITDDWEAREIAGMIDVSPQQREERQTPPAPPPDDDDPPKAQDFNDDDSGVVMETEPKSDSPKHIVAAAAAGEFVPNGKIGSKEQEWLDGLTEVLGGASTEAQIEEAFDLADAQTELAGNDLAIGKAFEIKDKALTALATKQHADLEAAGQTSLFGDAGGPPSPPED